MPRYKLEDTHMGKKSTLQLVIVLPAFSLLPLLRVSAQEQSEASFQILATYDYPGAVGFINSGGINDEGDVAGYYLQPSGDFRGFVRSHVGTFSLPIVAPNDTSGVTYATDINSTPTVCGESYDSVNNAFHGYLLTDEIFTLFDIEGAASTSVVGINVSGHFVGSFGPDANTGEGYMDVDGVVRVSVFWEP